MVPLVEIRGVFVLPFFTLTSQYIDNESIVIEGSSPGVYCLANVLQICYSISTDIIGYAKQVYGLDRTKMVSHVFANQNWWIPVCEKFVLH